MQISQINLVVTDLTASRGFYETVFGARFRPIDIGERPAAWAASTPVPLTVHSQEFASWWDPSSPGPQPGATVLDLDVTAAERDRLLSLVAPAGGAVVAAATDMPWGQSYAVLIDPDGYRWGLKAPLAP